MRGVGFSSATLAPKNSSQHIVLDILEAAHTSVVLKIIFLLFHCEISTKLQIYYEIFSSLHFPISKAIFNYINIFALFFSRLPIINRNVYLILSSFSPPLI